MNMHGYVVVIGAANFDIHGQANNQLIAEDSNPGKVTMCAGGVARNIAENLARLKIQTRLLTVVGNDAHGQQLLDRGIASGIDMQHVLVEDNSPTSSYLSIVENNGEMQVAVSDMDIIKALDIDYIKSHESMIKQASIIVVDSNLPQQTLHYVLQTFAECPIFVDPVSTSKVIKLEGVLDGVHTLKPGFAEARTISGLSSQSLDDLPQLANWFHLKGVKRVFISLGDNGVFYSADDQQGLIAASSEQITNSNGAGDAFISGLVYCYLEQLSLHKTLEFAQAAAELTISHPSTNHPQFSIEYINKRLRKIKLEPAYD